MALFFPHLLHFLQRTEKSLVLPAFEEFSFSQTNVVQELAPAVAWHDCMTAIITSSASQSLSRPILFCCRDVFPEPAMNHAYAAVCLVLSCWLLPTFRPSLAACLANESPMTIPGRRVQRPRASETCGKYCAPPRSLANLPRRKRLQKTYPRLRCVRRRPEPAAATVNLELPTKT